jgi:branched-chain amino acid transport system permease protein
MTFRSFQKSNLFVPIGILAAFFGLLAVPAFVNSYVQFIINLALVYILVCLGFNLVLGFLGQLAFANAALFGIGAYATGIGMEKLHLPFLVALGFSAVVGMLCGILIGLPALRGVRQFYLAIMTMAVGELLRWTYIHAEWLTHGSTGLEVPAAAVFGFSIRSETTKFYVFLAIVIPFLWLVSNLIRSRVGRAIVAIRESEQVAKSLAIPTSFYFVLVFGLSGLLVGVAGGLFAIAIGRVVPESFNLVQLIQQFAMVMVGGLGSVAGSVIGALVVVAIPELTRGFPGMEEMFFSLILIAVLLVMPNGLVGIVTKLLRWRPRRLIKGDNR